MRALILGGTEFLGRHIASAFVSSGHDVTLFNRGLRVANVGLPVETINGDRRGDLRGLRGRQWDVAIDTSGYLPRLVNNAALALRDAVEHYTFISTVSVYCSIDRSTSESSMTDDLTADQEQAAERIEPPPRSIAGGGYGASYGALKACCETVVHDAMSGRALVVRPGFIIGPNDYSPRFSYWIERALRGGPALAPGRPGRPIRLIDARDIAAWIVRMALQRTTGVFNATGADGVTMGDLISACSLLDGGLTWHWIEDSVLAKEGISPFEDLPYWLPEVDNSVLEVRNDAAIGRGLAFRPLAESVSDTAVWRKSMRSDDRRTAGLDADREQSLLSRLVSGLAQNRGRAVHPGP